MVRYLQVNLLGPGPRLIEKKNLPGCGLTKFEKHYCNLSCRENAVVRFSKPKASFRELGR